MEEQTDPGLSRQDPDALCAICQTPISASDAEIHHCPDCGARYHEECWRDNQGCAIYGCPGVPETEQLQSIEMPISYWGRENKPCPECGKEILAAAIRCRFCGTVFSTPEPIDKEAFRERREQQDRLPALRKKVVFLLIFCIIPFTAPLAAIIGLIWRRIRREDIAAMPALYSGLIKVAIGVAIGQTAAVLLLMMVYSLLNT